MQHSKLVLSDTLKNQLQEQMKHTSTTKFKKLLALKLLDESAETPRTVKEVSKIVGLSEVSIFKLLKSVRESDGTLEELLSRKQYDCTKRVSKYDATFEARAITIACSTPPDGINHWTLKLIADKMVELNYYDYVPVSAVQRILARNELKPHKSQYWKIPPKKDHNFVCQMENILDTYEKPYNEKEPLICLDETTKQLLGHVVEPLPSIPHHIAKVDDEYIRCGVASIFLAVEPATRRTFISIGKTRNRVDFANFLEGISKAYPDAEKIHVVLDNLNVHSVSSLYVAYSPLFANKIASRFVFHYTPKHGSWLNMAEAAIGQYKNSCLKERVSSLDDLRMQTIAYLKRVNQKKGQPFNWTFTSEKARIKLKSLYPKYKYEITDTEEVVDVDKDLLDGQFLDSTVCAKTGEFKVAQQESFLENKDGEQSYLCIVIQE